MPRHRYQKLCPNLYLLDWIKLGPHFLLQVGYQKDDPWVGVTKLTAGFLTFELAFLQEESKVEPK